VSRCVCIETVYCFYIVFKHKEYLLFQLQYTVGFSLTLVRSSYLVVVGEVVRVCDVAKGFDSIQKIYIRNNVDDV
jgi:hypothetical protein